MQFKIPQNIDLEDKIVGPLTLIQFLYVLTGSVIVYLLYLSIGPSFVFWLLSAPVAAICLALAFLKIQDRPLAHFIKASLIYFSRPRTRVWQREGVNLKAVAAKEKKVDKVVIPKKKIEKYELEKLAHSLDTRGAPPA